MEKVNTITIDELRDLMRSGERFTLVDIREAHQYNYKHIPGALNIPTAQIERRAYKELPKDELIVLYGDSSHSADAIDAAKTLDRLDYQTAVAEGGRKAWQDHEWSFNGDATGALI